MVYMDHAATTRPSYDTLNAMLPWICDNYGNPSSGHKAGRSARKAIEDARAIMAKEIGAKPKEIYFTSGGTEADNWALISTAEKFMDKGRHIITSKIEHPAVLNTCRYLEQRGYEVTYVDVDKYGFVSPKMVKDSIRPDTILVSIMYANNEIGSIQPIKDIAMIANQAGVLFHTDAVQAFTQVRINVDELGTDMLSASGHKVGGPKGIGFLYIRDGIDIGPLIHGGGQESGKRSGTENVIGIVGMGSAVEEASHNDYQRVTQMRDHMISRLIGEIDGVRLNGSRFDRLPGNVNVSFSGIDGETVLMGLEVVGDIYASAGSACHTGSSSPSHVLEAIGVPPELIRGSLRLTIGPDNTMEDVNHTVDCIKNVVNKLRYNEETGDES